MVVVSSMTKTYIFSRGSERIAIALRAGQETVVHGDLLPPNGVRISHSEWGVLPVHQWLVAEQNLQGPVR